LISEVWSLLVPPILTVLDDESAYIKTRGCSLLSSLLEAMTPELLRKTGLAGVFGEAVFPCLLYLPSLTPQTQSIQLLNEAYSTLIKISSLISKWNPSGQVELLDKVIREGILAGFTYADENVEVTKELLKETEKIVKLLKIRSVKHLKVCL
jgi:tRNA nucleotidyltransferase (CCA-adding enzyme)